MKKKSTTDKQFANIEEGLSNAITIIEWPDILLNNNFNHNFYLIELEIYNENQRIIKINA